MSAATLHKTNLISIDELDHAIVSCAARINAATYDMLLLVRQFDERAGFLRWGLDNCAEWLAWRCDLSLITAKEKLRTAHALKALPAISAAFSQIGSQVPNITNQETASKSPLFCTEQSGQAKSCGRSGNAVPGANPSKSSPDASS